MDTIESLYILKALSDGTRLNIIRMLLEHDYCVGALAFHLGTSEAAISQHLRMLRKVGIVRGEKRGYYTHYDINKDMIEECGQMLVGLATAKIDRVPCKFEATKDHSACRVLRKEMGDHE